MRKIIPALFILLIFMAACGDEPDAAPTPFPPTPTSLAALRKSQAFPVTVQDLLLNPELYRDALVQVTGRYERRPLLVCESANETYSSPATWVLKDENGLVLDAGEYDEMLRSLLPDDLTITVSGYWEEWQGAVGCGKQAEPTSLWYLKVTDIVSPSPIAQVTLTPGGPVENDEGGDTAVNPQPTASGPIADTGGALTATPENIGGETATPAAGQGTPTPGLAGTASATPLSGDNQNTPTPAALLPTPTSTTAVTLPTASATPLNGTATPTTAANATATAPAGSTPTTTPNALATATSSPGNLTDVPMDDIYIEDIYYGTLGSGEKHIWDVIVDDSTVITISVAAEPQMNISFDLVDDNGQVVATQNVPSGGAIGTLAGIAADPANFYTLEIYPRDANLGSYAVTLWGNDAFAVVNQAVGYLDYGDMESATLPANGASHYWFFYGRSGDVIDIVASPASGLLLLSLYDAQGQPVVDSSGNDVELIDNEVFDVALTETGLYTIWLIENDFQSTNYTIQVSRN